MQDNIYYNYIIFVNMKKILLIVIAGISVTLPSCTAKMEEKPAFHFYRSAIFSPKLLVGTAD